MSSQLPVRLVFLGSKPIGYQCLDHLIAVRASLSIEIAGVLTQYRKEFGAGADVAALATQHGIPVLTSLDEVPDCDLLYSVQYHEILKQPVIDKAAKIAVNLHMAPLPEYRGCNQFSMAIIDDKKEFGTTIHRIDTRIDHGDILFQKRFAVPSGCWVQELYELTFDASVALFRDTLPDLIAGTYTLTPQAELVAQYGTSLYLRKEIAALKNIDLSWDAEQIQRYIRATSMPGFEPPYTIIGGQKIYFSPSPVS
jgi:methionyl-tRNA formyltransferase